SQHLVSANKRTALGSSAPASGMPAGHAKRGACSPSGASGKMRRTVNISSSSGYRRHFITTNDRDLRAVRRFPPRTIAALGYGPQAGRAGTSTGDVFIAGVEI